MADSRHFENRNRLTILLKFGTVTQIGPLQGTDR